VDRLALHRARWRLRGAWQWPAFAAAVVVEGVLLNLLPVWGDGPGGLVGGLLVAGGLNIALVAVAAPVGGFLLRRRRPDLPRPIAADYVGTGLVAALLAALVVGGLAHRGERRREEAARAAQLIAVAHYLAAQAPAYRARLALADTMRLDAGLYRTCVPSPDRRHWLCLIVDTTQAPPGVTRDRDGAPNDAYRRPSF
jgi:hypothetical protein